MDAFRRGSRGIGVLRVGKRLPAHRYGTVSLLDMPAQRRRTRSYNVQLWADALDMQQRVRGGVEDMNPDDSAAPLAERER